MEPVLGAAEVEAYLDEVFPQVRGRFRILELGEMRLSCEMAVTDADLRPGGTVSGPAMFTAADCAFYMLTLAMIGREALTVTTGATINFMRKPRPGPIRAEARLLKLGRSLSVGDVLLYSDGVAAPVAQASLTYSIPPKRGQGG
ncbi:PaaI family thioesterase [Halovulum dunhuangense]|uniref:PaaI family thioesterase n=1 Tax=Halovulum dunhuangense TaxID=1505036 RepID=A0A849L2M1_9RHOB|nr:PaaI family thioesterase [Halovulum dunhuangense]NNU80598.1 PaaI family thioesterase [Halovulum dunhuangense]